MKKEIEKLLRDERVKILKALKPGECGIIYDEKGKSIIGICNVKGELKITKKKIEDI